MLHKYFLNLTIKINVLKLNSVFNAVQTWMFKRKHKLKKDKTNIMVVGIPLQLRKIDISSNLSWIKLILICQQN